MMLYLFANLNNERGASHRIVALQSKEAVNAYLRLIYERNAWTTADHNGGRLPEGVETEDAFCDRMWRTCVHETDLETCESIASLGRIWRKGREEDLARVRRQKELLAECQAHPERFRHDPNAPVVDLEDF